MGFYRERNIKAVRKARNCCGCGHRIEAGEPALECSGKQDDFWSGTYHHDCRAAECDLNSIRDTCWSDDWSLLSDIELDEWSWLIETYPTVAARLNITAERLAEIEAEQARCRAAFARKAEA